jgi:hypothetical protein
MGVGTRVFFFDKDSVRRFPYAKFRRLWEGKTNERLPQYAGKRIKYALVTLGTENRRPIEIINIDFSYVSIDIEGRFDQYEIQEMLMDAMNCLDAPLKKTGRNVIDAASAFAKKRYCDKYLWTPTNDELSEISLLIFD